MRDIQYRQHKQRLNQMTKLEVQHMIDMVQGQLDNQYFKTVGAISQQPESLKRGDSLALLKQGYDKQDDAIGNFADLITDLMD